MRFLILSFFSLLLASCVNDKSIKKEELTGKWIVIEALRNNKKTNTLEGAFFYFDQNRFSRNFLSDLKSSLVLADMLREKM